MLLPITNITPKLINLIFQSTMAETTFKDVLGAPDLTAEDKREVVLKMSEYLKQISEDLRTDADRIQFTATSEQDIVSVIADGATRIASGYDNLILYLTEYERFLRKEKSTPPGFIAFYDLVNSSAMTRPALMYGPLSINDKKTYRKRILYHEYLLSYIVQCERKLSKQGSVHVHLERFKSNLEKLI